MSGRRQKAIRRYVKETYPFMSAETLYQVDVFGGYHLAPICQKAFVQNIKRNLKRGLKI